MPQLAILGGKPSVASAQHLRWPVLSSEDKDAVIKVIERGVLSGHFAPEVRGLEESFGAYVGAKYCLATNSGTAALHMALAAVGVQPGDEVVVPAFTFVATALAALHQNAIPVFVDIEPETWGMDPNHLEAILRSRPRVRAIVPVHIHGTPCDLNSIQNLAQKYGVPVIEDACQAHGSEYQGKKVGGLGAMGAFSLQSSKSLACGEGGLLVTNDRELYEKAHRTRMFGENVLPKDGDRYRLDRALDADRAYDSTTMGWMYRLNEMSAALARSQLKRLDTWNANARRNAEAISSRLAKLPGVRPPVVPSDRTSCFHKYRVVLDASKMGVRASPKRVRDAMVKALVAEGLEAVLWQTQPVPAQTLFQQKMGYGRGCPWDHASPVDYRVEQFSQTVGLLESSLCLFSQTYPIAPQPLSLCEAYADAFARAWERLDEILAAVPEK